MDRYTERRASFKFYKKLSQCECLSVNKPPVYTLTHTVFNTFRKRNNSRCLLNRTAMRGVTLTRSSRAGLVFPVGRVYRHLRQGKYASRIGAGAPVFLAAVLEFLIAEVVELAGNIAQVAHRARISPRHVMLAVRNDEEFTKLLDNVTIPSCGVTPNVYFCLLGRKGQGAWFQKSREYVPYKFD